MIRDRPDDDPVARAVVLIINTRYLGILSIWKEEKY
jgi:hypothetical protein